MPHQICFDLTAGYTSAIYIAVAYIGSDILDRELKKGALVSVPAKFRYWELYRAKIHDMVRDTETCFRELFGDDFARAYEEQLKRLKAQRRGPKR